jgi:hypothetical protein
VLRTAFSFIPVTIGGLAGVPEHEAGLASDLIDTTQQLGAALGLAIASTVAASHYGHLLQDEHPAESGARRRLPVGVRDVVGLRRVDRPSRRPKSPATSMLRASLPDS